MNKAELLQRMRELDLLNSFSRHRLWVQAFDLYNKENKPRLKLTACKTCFKIVKQWLLA